jgi:hypothetical protein
LVDARVETGDETSGCGGGGQGRADLPPNYLERRRRDPVRWILTSLGGIQPGEEEVGVEADVKVAGCRRARKLKVILRGVNRQ